MKTQMIIGGILFGVAACTAPADGYRITGNIEGAGDGKAILLQSAGFGEPTMGDTVNMRNGKFVFEGRLESPVSVTVKVCPDSDQPASLGFIAENSPIRVMAAWKDVIERYGYRSIGGQTVEGSLNQEVYEKIAGVYGQILKAPEHKEYAEAQQKMAIESALTNSALKNGTSLLANMTISAELTTDGDYTNADFIAATGNKVDAALSYASFDAIKAECDWMNGNWVK